jgi:hypothetical protein
LTISQADIRLSKNGAAFAQTNNAAGATHMEKGYYGVPLDTTDTATLGRLRVHVHESGALPVWEECLVVTANIYDSLVSGTDLVDVSVTQWLGTAAATPDTAGYPKTTIKSGTGTGEVSLSAGLVRLSGTGVDDIHDEVFEGTYTLRQFLRLIAAAAAGEISGAATTTLIIRDVSDTKPRITATVDASGNRSALTLDAT